MNIEINRKVFADALAEVLPFAPQKSPIAILKYAKITTKGNRLKIEANDTFSSVRKYIDAVSIDCDGQFLVDCNAIAKFTAKCKGETLAMSVDEEMVEIKHSKGKAQFQAMKVADYPDFDMPTADVAEITIPTASLAESIGIGMRFVGTDDLRPMMKPIYAYVKDGEFGYCATDTRKLVNDHNKIDGLNGADVHWFIESAVFGPLLKICRDADSAVVRITPTHVAYRIGGTVIQTLQTKGQFPAFERVIPKTWAMECSVDKSELVDSLGRVALFCEDSRLIKLNVSRMDMTITADNVADMKFSSETLLHNGCNGEIKIGMQVDYMTTCLCACASNEVILLMSEPSRPMMMRQSDKPNLTILLMPMVFN